MKKGKRFIASVFVFLFLVSTISFISAQNPLDGLVGQIENVSTTIEGAGDSVDRLTKEDVKWEYLSEQWQIYLLKNKGVSFIDSILRKGNIVFLVLFGRDYSLSLTLLFLIILWFYFWNQFNKIFGTFSTFSSTSSSLISLGFTIILAQMNFFDLISELIFKLIFYREGAFGWVWSIGVFFVVILVAMIFGRFLVSFKKIFKRIEEEKRKKARELGEEFHYSRIKMISNTLVEAFGLKKIE